MWRVNKDKHYKKCVARLSHKGKPIGYVARHHNEQLWRAGICAFVPGFQGGKQLGEFPHRWQAKLAVEAALVNSNTESSGSPPVRPRPSPRRRRR